MSLVEVHIIQNLAPNNLNRDDTGSPKDAFFGGVRRARLSSQAQKRAVRQYLRGFMSGFSESELALRTRRLIRELTKLLEDQEHPQEEVEKVITTALKGMGLGMAADKPHLTEYLLFLGQREIESLALAIRGHWDVLAEVAHAEDSQAVVGMSRKERKKAARAAVPDDVKRDLKAVLDGGKAVDLALFGRMLADEPKWRVDAAVQVAHAISTHRVDREFDFYTAVDDVNPEEQTGAGMMGDVEFCSACMYRYANLDLDQLRENLQDDRALAARAVEAFLRGFILTLPSGKQNSFAAHNPPGFVALVVRSPGMPRSLAGAFEKPIHLRDGKSLSGLSTEALLTAWEVFDRAYGQPAEEWVALMNLTDGTLHYHQDKLGDSLDKIVGATMQGVRTLLGVA
ncbi:MAG: type I-E CRISPR-associated protein Cas7/Cse4/CasC [Bacillota bacterium]